MQDQKTLLEILLRFENPDDLEKIMTALRVYDPDRGEDLVKLTRENIISILERYIRSELTEQEVEDWANAVELREDIEFGVRNEEVVLDAIGELANPILTQPLTAQSAHTLIEKLRTAPFSLMSEE